MSRFWVMLVLAAIIAAAGVVSDSTATVIGAMIVAPLTLRAALDASGMADLSVDLELVPGNVVELPGS